MSKLVKTFWVDRYDHILSREEVEKVPLLSVVDVKGDDDLKALYLTEEEKVWGFVQAWFEATGENIIEVFVRRNGFHEIVPISQNQQLLYDQLARVTLLEIKLDEAGKRKLQDLLKLALREILTVTIKAKEHLLQTGYDMALWLQHIERQTIDELANKTGVYCLRVHEQEDNWQGVQDVIKDYKNKKSKVAGALFGMAIGDGLGYPAEFLTIDEIKAKLLDNGFLHPDGAFIQVTDDTQMALAVANALLDLKDSEPVDLEKSLRKHFVTWLDDPANNRAPGMTCLASCERLAKGLSWLEATDKGSKGCGANMRVLPIGLWEDVEEAIADQAQFQSAMTHGHPTALVASELTAVVVHKLLNGVAPDQLLDALFVYADTQRNTYHEEYLQTLWDRPPFRSPQEYIQLGWEECLEKLQAIKQGLQLPEKPEDPCAIGGAGWTAEESLATALYCFLLSPEDPIKVLQTAICTSGDSDSIACLAGGFVGAYLGYEALPQDRVQNVEYKEELWELVRWFG